MRLLTWLIGAVVVVGILCLIILKPVPMALGSELPHVDFVTRALYVLIFASVMCLYRILSGPTAADRIVAIDIFGILIVGFCAIVSISTGRSWYIDIGIAWALQSFIGTLALSKYLEGRALDE